MIIVFNFLTNNVVESDKDIVIYVNIVRHSCVKDNKIED